MLPGVPELLHDLSAWSLPRVHVALASSAGKSLFDTKTASLPAITNAIAESHRVFGNDPAMEGKKGKPAPDIFLLALRLINENLGSSERPVLAKECLVFEDSIAGVEAGPRAGMRVVWVPHSGLSEVCRGKEEMVLMGATTGEKGEFCPEVHERSRTEKQYSQSEESQQRKSEDGLGELLTTLEEFPYDRYGIRIQRSDD